jgi:ribosomal protein S27AE
LAIVIVAGVVLAIFLIGLAAYPLLRPAPGAPVKEGAAAVELAARRDRIYEELRELEFDYRVGKITHAEYDEGRERLELDAARVLQALDTQASAVDEAIEREIRSLRATKRACPACGAPHAPAARFCGRCGASLRVAVRQ